jgi:Toprim-like
MEGVRRQPEETLEPVLPYLTDWALMNVLVDVPQKLLDFRRLVRHAVDAYQVRWNPDSRVWVLPLRDPYTGGLLGAQLRSVGTFLTQPAGLPKSTTLFGYAQMEQYDTCLLVESPLDAVRAFGLGIPALASLGAWPSNDQMTLLARCFAAVYVALDDDKAGHDGAEVVTAGLRKRGCAAIPFRYDGLTDEDGNKVKDIGDVADDGALVEAWQKTQTMGFM